MEKKVVALLLVIFSATALVMVASAVLLGGFGAEESDSAGDYSKSWRQVASFSGVEGKTLPVFRVVSGEWRINYSWSGDSEWAGFNFFVYPEGETVMYVEMVMADGGSGEDVTYVYSGAGGYYVKVGAANLDGWSLIVEELR